MTQSNQNKPAASEAKGETPQPQPVGGGAGAGTVKKRFNVVMEESKTALKFENVVARKAEVQDMLTAQRVSASNEGIEFTLGVIAECCLFDGKKLTVEDLRKISFEDFLALQEELMAGGLMGSEEQLYSSLGKLGLNMEQ